MKRLFIILSLVGLFVLSPLKLVFAQEEAKENIAFTFISYDDVDDIKFTGGVGLRIISILGFEGRIYSQITAGKYAEVDVEPGFTTNLGSKAFGGVIIGPTLDMENGEDRTAATYLPFVSGLMAGYDLSESLGVHGFVKYKFTVTETATFQDGWQLGLGLFTEF